jgi:hypothetical protein
MTITAETDPPDANQASADLYRDIHKGIRAELFAVTGAAGRVDPADRSACGELADHINSLVEVLEMHSDHEDTAIQPVLEQLFPGLAARIQDDHQLLTTRTAALVTIADKTVASSGQPRSDAARELYLELAGFTGIYLSHQDVEEREVLPALREAVGSEEVGRIHARIIASIPPDKMASSLAFMLPAMNIDDRAELLGGLRAAAPPQVFEGVWGLARSVLHPADHAALGARLGVA